MKITDKDLTAIINAHDILYIVYKVPLENESMKDLRKLEMKMQFIKKEQSNG